MRSTESIYQGSEKLKLYTDSYNQLVLYEHSMKHQEVAIKIIPFTPQPTKCGRTDTSREMVDHSL